MVREGRSSHQRFLQEMEENRERHSPLPHRGAEVDEAAADRQMAAILSIEGAGAHGLRHRDGGDGSGMGRAVSQPRVEVAQCSVRLQCPAAGAGPHRLAPGLPAADGGAVHIYPDVSHQRTRGSGTWCAWPGAGGGHPTPTAGPCAPTGATSPTTCSGPSGTAAAWWG